MNKTNYLMVIVNPTFQTYRKGTMFNVGMLVILLLVPRETQTMNLPNNANEVLLPLFSIKAISQPTATTAKEEVGKDD
jgi:hypothetical protein